MGARQSKRVEISSASKKGDAENGAIVSAEEKLEKIEEGETAVSKTNANGSTTTSSTVTAEQQETVTSSSEVAAVPETTPSKEVETKNESVTEAVASPEKSTDAEATSPTSATEDGKSVASPSEVKSTEESASSANEKKKKDKKKKWSFRSFSFSKKDRQKPVASKDEAKQRDLLPEDNEAVSQAEQQNDDEAEKTKKVEEENKKKDDQVPPPLPTSPPPTPAEEIAVVAAAVAPVATPAVVPVKEESQIVSEGDVDASGGGEALAEPLEEGELEQSTTSATVTTAAVSSNGISSGLTNGTNGIVESNGKTENEDLPPPVCELKAPVDVESVTTKIDSLKLQIVTDSVEPQALAQNGFGDASSNGHSFNGDCNGTELIGSVECPLVSDSVVSVDHVDVSADISADN